MPQPPPPHRHPLATNKRHRPPANHTSAPSPGPAPAYLHVREADDGRDFWAELPGVSPATGPGYLSGRLMHRPFLNNATQSMSCVSRPRELASVRKMTSSAYRIQISQIITYAENILPDARCHSGRPRNAPSPQPTALTRRSHRARAANRWKRKRAPHRRGARVPSARGARESPGDIRPASRSGGRMRYRPAIVRLLLAHVVVATVDNFRRIPVVCRASFFSNVTYSCRNLRSRFR